MRYPQIDLGGAVVLITGGGRGIGRATGAAFAARGSTVCLADLDESAAAESAADLGAHGFPVDVTERASFAACVEDVLTRFRRIDVLVNNAGVMPLGSFLDQPDDVSATTLDVNVWGPIHGMRLVLPAMLAQGRGHVVNIASMAGKIAIPGLAVYNASKFAVVGLSASVRAEFAGTGVSVSAVLPSAVRTRLTSGVPLGHGLPTVDPEEVARAVLASVHSRRAEIAVPGYLGLWDLVDAVVPERVQRLAFGLLGGGRALNAVDHEARRDYEQGVAAQASDQPAQTR
jgi:NAD(P)-dependent dehydrogenase (short-subunit alcohol dehydrogenase family)